MAKPTPMLPTLSPETILRERYKITHVVGQGGMGSVYRAEDLRLPGRLCAIKEIQLDPLETAELRAQTQAQFLREASILAQLDHPNLPKVSDFFANNGRDYLVMDFVPGQDLKELLDSTLAEGKAFKESLVCNWGLQILDALIYLHEQDPPVVHRDIKPANIKLTPDNRIKLVDFGLVKLLAADEMRTITVIQGRGTALYTPLEQYGGELDHTDGRSDLYALGATLYTLLMGYPPLSAKDRFLNPNGLEPPHQVNPEISATVSEAIMWAMAMHPDQRPQTARILQQALLGRARPPQLTRPLTPFRTAEALAANRYLLLTCALLFLIALVGIFST